MTGLEGEQTSHFDLLHKLPRLYFYSSFKENIAIINYIFKMYIDQ